MFKEPKTKWANIDLPSKNCDNFSARTGELEIVKTHLFFSQNKYMELYIDGEIYLLCILAPGGGGGILEGKKVGELIKESIHYK